MMVMEVVMVVEVVIAEVTMPETNLSAFGGSAVEDVQISSYYKMICRFFVPHPPTD